MKNHYVYKFTHLGDEFPKSYIGKRSCKGPISEDDYKTSSKIVKPMLEKTPWFFKKEILGVYDTEEEAYEAEAKFCTELHITTGMLYNIVAPPGSGTLSGASHPMYGKNHSEEAKRKMSAIKKGKTTWIKGKKHTEKTKEKMRLAKLNSTLTQDHKTKIRKTMGRKICVNNTWYYSLRHASENENIGSSTLGLARRLGNKTVKNKQGEIFHLDY